MQRTLVERAQRGDREAFTDLAAASLARLDTVARLILRDPDLAKDAVQNGLVRAWRDLPTLRDPDRFDAWIRRLVVRACLDEVRGQRRRPITTTVIDIGQPIVADASTAVADQDQLERAFRRLRPEDRAILVLRHYLDLSVPDIADALRIPLGTAKSRLHRAMDRAPGVAGGRREACTGIRGGADGMTTSLDLERSLGAWFRADAGEGTPDHLDEIVAGVAREPQRPWWSSPERWLPMDTTLARAADARRCGPHGLLTGRSSYLLGIVGNGAAIVGSRPPRAPAVRPRAHRDHRRATRTGDIVVVDPATRADKVLIGGPERDVAPLFSPDGTKLAFFRETVIADIVMVATADGTDIRQVSRATTCRVDWERRLVGRPERRSPRGLPATVISIVERRMPRHARSISALSRRVGSAGCRHRARRSSSAAAMLATGAPGRPTRWHRAAPVDRAGRRRQLRVPEPDRVTRRSPARLQHVGQRDRAPIAHRISSTGR